MTTETEPFVEPQPRRHSWPQDPSQATTAVPAAALFSPRPQPFQILANAAQFITSCGLVSVVIAIVLRYLAQPSAIPLPIHRPVAQLPSTLRSFIPPSTPYGHPSSYIAKVEFFYEDEVRDLCDCPLRWIRERRRYSPDADGLYDYELWADPPKDAPGKLYPLDEAEMDELGLICEAALREAKAMRQTSQDIMTNLQRAHQDSVTTVYSIANHLAKLHGWQHERNEKGANVDDLILSKYLVELNALTFAQWVEEKSVPDPSLPSSGSYQRKNRRAFVTTQMLISRGQLRLHSLEMLASQLSNFSDFVMSLNSHVATLEGRIKPLIVDPKNKKQKCLTGWPKSLPPLREEVEDASRLASDQARTLRQSIGQLDAFRLSLSGFIRGRDEHSDYDGLAGDHWNATWDWMGLHTEDWAPYQTSSTRSMMAWLRRWLPRHPIRLPPIETQYTALLDALRRAEKEAEMSWIPFYHPPLTNLRVPKE